DTQLQYINIQGGTGNDVVTDNGFHGHLRSEERRVGKECNSDALEVRSITGGSQIAVSETVDATTKVHLGMLTGLTPFPVTWLAPTLETLGIVIGFNTEGSGNLAYTINDTQLQYINIQGGTGNDVVTDNGFHGHL